MAHTVIKGRDVELLNLTLSSTDDIQIGFTKPVNTVIIKARTAVDIQLRTSRGAGNYYTIASGQVLQLDVQTTLKDNVVQACNLWIRSVSSTPVVEVIGIYGA